MAINTSYEFNIIKQAFTDKDKFLFCIEKIKNPNIFIDPIANLYWRIFKIIYQEGQELSFSKVEDILRSTDNAQHIGHFKHVVEGEYNEEYEWQYHLFFLEEQYRKSVMLEMASLIQKSVGKSSSQQILESCNSALRELNSEEANSINFKKAYEETIKQIADIHTGSTKSVFFTGNKRFDEVATLSPKKLITWAAQKKIGKSRFMVDLTQRLITHNPKDIAIQWYSLEMKSEELVRCFISRMLNLTDKQLMGKGYKVTEFEMGCINNLIKYFEKYPIEFIDEAVNINNICSKFERFAERHPGKTPICIIDNLGLIKPHINDSIAFDDDVARMLKNLRDKTNGMINVLHHLTKESESKWNKDAGYEPKTTHIRGSSRIADFSNMVVLLHRPDHYKDLVEEAKLAGTDINGKFIVNISENRDGESDRIVMNHKIQYCHFSEETIDSKQEIKT